MSAKIIAVDKLATRARNCIPRESTLCTNRGELRSSSVRICPNPLSRAQLSDNSSARIIRAKSNVRIYPAMNGSHKSRKRPTSGMSVPLKKARGAIYRILFSPLRLSAPLCRRPFLPCHGPANRDFQSLYPSLL
jgi:hypothetical protein